MPNWGQVLSEIHDLSSALTAKSKRAPDSIRGKYLAALHGKRKRNVIAYYSGFLSKPDASLLEINDEDKNGFMMAVHGLDKSLGLDLLIHTPGGSIAATESIVDYLRKMFGENIVAIVPQIAMSAGTMLACACREIIMASHSNLGPVDPHLRGIPAHGVLKEFEEALLDIKADPQRIKLWEPILGQYRPTFLRQCRLAIKWSEQFVRQQLVSVMLKSAGTPRQRQSKARRIVRALSNSDQNRSHNRHIHYDECRRIGLNVTPLEADQELQDLVLTVHHCYMHALMNTASHKIIENHRGVAFVKQTRLVTVPGGS
jgi:hypothetical protein